MFSKKTQYLELDIIIAIVILIAGIVLIRSSYVETSQNTQESFLASDILNLIENSDLHNIDQAYLSTVNSTEIDINASIAKQLVLYLAEDEVKGHRLGQELIDELINTRFPEGIANQSDIYGFNITIKSGNKVFKYYGINKSVEKNIVSSRTLLTGLQVGKPIRGFVGTLFLKKVLNRSTSSYTFLGGYIGQGNLTVNLTEIPSDANITNFTFEGVAGNDFDLYMNDVFCKTIYRTTGANLSNASINTTNVSACISEINPGAPNLLDLKFNGTEIDTQFIGGGFFKTDYRTATNTPKDSGEIKKYFPGIEGIINYFDSIHIPGNLDNMELQLDFFVNRTIYPNKMFVTIGNYSAEFVASDNPISLNLKGVGETNPFFGYSRPFRGVNANNTTIPIRIGISNITVNETNFSLKANAIVVTDRTGSMHSNNDVVNGSDMIRRKNAAHEANREFIKTFMNNSENKLGLMGYGSFGKYTCSHHHLTKDNESLLKRNDNYIGTSDEEDWWRCGYTCISCGLYSAISEIKNEERVHGYEYFNVSDDNFNLLDEDDLEHIFTLNVDYDPSKLVKARLSFEVQGLEWGSGSSYPENKDNHNCVMLNDNFLGKVCYDKYERWGGDDDAHHTCVYSIDPDILIDGNNELNITHGDKAGCSSFDDSDRDDFSFGNIEFHIWQGKTDNVETYSNMSSTNFSFSNSNRDDTFTFNIPDSNVSKIRSAFVELHHKDMNYTHWNCVYLNGNFTERLDSPYWRRDPSGEYIKALFEVPIYLIKSGQNEIKVTAGTQSFGHGTSDEDGGCLWTDDDADSWDAVNISFNYVVSNEEYDFDRENIILLMSDGSPNTRLGDEEDSSSGGPYDFDATQEPIYYGQVARDLGISLYTVFIGPDTGNGDNVMSEIACGEGNDEGCEFAFNTTNLDDLVTIYTGIATTATGGANYSAQIINFSNLPATTYLYNTSYIWYNYTPFIPEIPPFGTIEITAETPKFDSCNPTININPEITPVQGFFTSYSGAHWTDLLEINGQKIYDLPSLSHDYLKIGDAFIVQAIGESQLTNTNNVNIRVGDSGSVPKGCSEYNKLIYRGFLNSTVRTPGIIANVDAGCNWTIEFNNPLRNETYVFPELGNATNKCYFTNVDGSIFNQNDVNDILINSLLDKLDVDDDNILDIDFNLEDIDFETESVEEVPYMWGPAVLEVNVWQ